MVECLTVVRRLQVDTKFLDDPIHGVLRETCEQVLDPFVLSRLTEHHAVKR